MKRCEHCHRHGGRISSNRLCEDCKARGWRWCSIRKHVVVVADYASGNHACIPCRRKESSQQKLKARGMPVVPPAGYVSLVEAATAAGMSRSWFFKLAQRARVPRWQRTPRGKVYLRADGVSAMDNPQEPSYAVGDVLGRDGATTYTLDSLNGIAVVVESWQGRRNVLCALSAWPREAAYRRCKKPKEGVTQ